MTIPNQILDDPRYPIGRFSAATAGTRAQQLETLSQLPTRLREAVSGLSDQQLDTPYRDGGWTVRQLVHHIADSHANAYIRFKLALTEDTPTITAYDEAAWARLPDSSLPVDESLNIIQGIHARLAALIQGMADSDFSRAFKHPERGRMELGANLALYAWHSLHHTAHITRLREQMGW